MKNTNCTTIMWTGARGDVFTMDATPFLDLIEEGSLGSQSEIQKDIQKFIDSSVLHFNESEQANSEIYRNQFNLFFKALVTFRDMVSSMKILTETHS